ncbi:AIPR family protein [Francisella philomiragia]|uniref:AIPR family protein n=1 Tax=Francisella philomiragia TaxID=28110 RepID=UPI001904FF26|nr:AIPR family protein [Francisella philomiragia]MBK2267177.1 AIPR family protein [Francisella philomiragia]MBK2278810.1 AIPR family protein [Francisella philomiragia]MBK2286664.1 AIPR family protein [Francisella philomiragia]MBK2288462.1 AIPR family protein [Francisella philomiragia]MBK2290183.1 AIPR family protein [Francisella philomiragia]
MNNNKIILEGCIKVFKESNELIFSDSQIFELFSLSQVHKDNDLTFENIEHSIVDGSNDGGIDSLMIFIDDEYIENIEDLDNFSFKSKTRTRFVISQCKKESSFKESSIDKIITTVPELFNLEKNETALLTRFNASLVSQTVLLAEAWKKTAIAGGCIYVDYHYITNATSVEINNVFEEKKEQLKRITSNIFSTKFVDFKCFSCKELLEFYQKQKSNRLSIEFKDRPLSISYGDDGIGYIGVVELAKYKQFLTSDSGEIRDDLFENNIRHFQGSVDVNKKIKNTIETKEDQDFWWLNNGVTIVAEDPKELNKQLSIENVQIVNGLQTSYSIYNAHNGDASDDRSVLVKVIIVNDNKEITDNIIASTNSQNPVSAVLLRATEQIQRELELYFLNEGYYYDRRKNYYKNLGKPATKIFSIQSLAQSVQTLIFEEPHSARATPTSLLKKDQTYNKIFDNHREYKSYLNCCLVNRKVHNFWLKHGNLDEKSKVSNFKFHLSLLMVRKIFGFNSLMVDNITNLNLLDLNESLFSETLKDLSRVIDDYLAADEKRNLINIAKTGGFTSHMLSSVS